MKLIKKSDIKKGFTLIEMVITMAVVIIILGFITNVFVQTIRIEEEVTNIGQMEIIATESISELLDDLRVAKAIDTSDPNVLKIATDSYTVMYTVDATDKILMREYENDTTSQPNEVLAKDFYMGYTMELSFSDTGAAATKDYVITVNVVIYDEKDVAVHSEEYVVRPSYINANS